MAKKLSKTTNGQYLYAFDAGNGACKGKSNQRADLIQFAPVIAPITDKRALKTEDEKPTISLQVDGKTLVFGVEDVFEHGKRTAIRRLNSAERYTSPDYFNLLEVLFLQVFAAQRGQPDYITPTGAINIPIRQFNMPEVGEEIKATLAGKHTLVDYEGCELRLEIDPRRLAIIPESTGALTHWAYDPSSLNRRKDVNTAGSTLVIDIGYETTDTSLYEGLKFQRDRAFTIPRAGMGIIARTIQEYARQVLRDADVSRIDAAMHVLAGMKMGAKKAIEPAPGVFLDVTEVYDSSIEEIALTIAQGVMTTYTESITRVLLAGGGAYHLADALASQFEGVEVQTVPDADAANVYGSFTLIQLQARQG